MYLLITPQNIAYNIYLMHYFDEEKDREGPVSHLKKILSERTDY